MVRSGSIRRWETRIGDVAHRCRHGGDIHLRSSLHYFQAGTASRRLDMDRAMRLSERDFWRGCSAWTPTVFFGVKTILLAMAVIGIEYSAPWFRRNFGGDALRFFDGCSFSIYLWQEPLYKLTGLGVRTARFPAYPGDCLRRGKIITSSSVLCAQRSMPCSTPTGCRANSGWITRERGSLRAHRTTGCP